VLALCTFFVIFLLRLDREQSPNVTPALWIPTIWMLYIASKPIGIWLGADSLNSDAGSPKDLVFLTVLILFALVVIVRRGVDWARALRENAWLAALLAFMLISVAWSDIPGTSFKRWVREFQAILMAFVVISEPSPRAALECLLRRTTYILIPFSLVLIKYFAIYGVQYGIWSGELMWVGVAQQKNSLGWLCIISGIFLIWSVIRRWLKDSPPAWRFQTHFDVLILLLTFYLLGGPRHSLFYSATSTYAFMAGLIICAWIYLRKKSGKSVKEVFLLAMIAIPIVLGVAAVFLGGSNISSFASVAGRDATLTGRTEVWASLMPVFKQNPLLGKGFGGFWTPRTKNIFRITGAHSGYLDVLLGTGFVGLILTSIVLLSFCRKAHKAISEDFYWGLLGFCYLIMTVIHNIGESSIDSFTSPLTAIVLFFAMCSVTTTPIKRESF
jgi:O-antigen ligase